MLGVIGGAAETVLLPCCGHKGSDAFIEPEVLPGGAGDEVAPPLVRQFVDDDPVVGWIGEDRRHLIQADDRIGRRLLGFVAGDRQICSTMGERANMAMVGGTPFGPAASAAGSSPAVAAVARALAAPAPAIPAMRARRLMDVVMMIFPRYASSPKPIRSGTAVQGFSVSWQSTARRLFTVS